MAEDHEVLRRAWEGRVPVSFVLAHGEKCSVEKPEPFLILVPRFSYLPLLTDRIQRYFQKYVDQSGGELWLEDENGIPVRWHYPVGVLYDLSVQPNVSCPWTLTVHFRDFPEQLLMRFSCKEAVEANFMSTVKEADCLKHRGTVINGMQQKEHKQLWQGIVNDKFDTFWTVNRRLMEVFRGEPGFRNIPFRVHRQDQSFLQLPFRPLSDSGQPHVLRDLLLAVVPGFSDSDDYPFYVLIQGIIISLDTPVQWLSEHLSHPDNFVHVCLVAKS